MYILIEKVLNKKNLINVCIILKNAKISCNSNLNSK